MTQQHDLQAQQEALLAALFAWPAQAAAQQLMQHLAAPGARTTRGIRAYQSNGHALAERALEAAYPVLQQLIGHSSFADLARALWHAQPPARGDLARWGSALADFVAASAQLQDTPYLVDVSRAEWALHRCACATDAAPRLETLQWLTSTDPAELSLQLAPGCCSFASRWPLASILLAHQTGTPSLAEAGAALRAGAAQDLVIWRQGWQAQLRQALAGEHALLTALLQGSTLAQALDTSPELDFSVWLPLAVQSGLFIAVVPQSP